MRYYSLTHYKHLSGGGVKTAAGKEGKHMLYVNYYVNDIFNHEQFINATKSFIDKRSIKAAFNAIKKYNAAVFIDLSDNTQVRYTAAPGQDFFDNKPTLQTLEKTILHFNNGIQNSDTPILIDYSTALKQELKKVKENE